MWVADRYFRSEGLFLPVWHYITLWHFVGVAAMPAILVVIKPNLAVVTRVVFVNKISDHADYFVVLYFRTEQVFESCRMYSIQPSVRFLLVVQTDAADYCNSGHNPKPHVLYYMSYN